MSSLRAFLCLVLLVVPLAGAKGQAIVNPSPLVLNPTGTTTVSQGHLAELLQRNPVPSVLTQILNGKPTAGVAAPSSGTVSGKPVQLQVAGRVTGPALARLLGGVLKRVSLPLLVAEGVRQGYCELNQDQGWVCDPLQGTEQTGQYCIANSPYYSGEVCDLTPTGANGKWVEAANGSNAGDSESVLYEFRPTQCLGTGERFSCYVDRRTATKYMGQWHWTGWSHSHVNTASLDPEGEACPAGPDGQRPEQTQDGKCPTGTMRPATQAEIDGRVVPGIEPAIADHVRDLIASGHDISPALVQESITGPAKTQGETTTKTTTLPDGTTQTTTQTTEYRHQYNNTGGQSSITTTTVNITNNNGTITEEETSGGEPPEQVSEPPLPGMPPVPDLYERKYPQGMVGVWNEKSQELKQTPIFAFLQGLVPSLGVGGCPTWQIPVMAGIGVTWMADVSVPCWVWAALRAIFLCTALLLCRRLIFGG